MQNVCFLFGAGADNNYEQQLPEGEEFAKALLLDKEFDKTINAFYQGRINERLANSNEKEKEWLPAVFKPAKLSVDSLYKASIKKEYASMVNGKELMANDFKRMEMLTLADKEDKISKKPNYMNQIDGRMHTLIWPRAYGYTSFCAVVSLYTRAYLTLCTKLFSKSPEDLLKDFSDISENLNGLPDKSTSSYYKIIKDHLVKEQFEEKDYIRIVTTNYTPFAEKVIGTKAISYPHGKLGWFESPYHLEVFDASDPGDKPKIDTEFVFPYIFLQSGVKPIVDPKQIDEYTKTKEYIIGSDILFICGYGINDDDNHINSILRHRITHETQSRITVYIHYQKEGKGDAKKEKENLLDKLRISDKSISSFMVEIINADFEDQNDRFLEIIKRYC